MKTHGMSRAREYVSWCNMVRRCTKPAATQFAHYGGRGILICERWKAFENFFADMGPRPAGRSLDRIDVNGNYEPDNCRWVTQQEQSSNTRVNRYITAYGVRMTLSQWADAIGVKRPTFHKRLRTKSPEAAVGFYVAGI